MALFLAAAGLSIWTGYLYWRHFSGEGETRTRAQELVRNIAAEERAVAELQQELASLDLEALNRRARFVNREIDRRRFSWSRLFDRVAEVLPGSVRLLSLTPRFTDERRSRKARRDVADVVHLEVRGVARNDAFLLGFVDRLFEHPAFSDPDLTRETRREDSTLAFQLSVFYTPDAEDATSADSVSETQDAPPSRQANDGETKNADAEGEE
ncbi:MAG: hypothetical protein OEM62_01555 [Acidobacteriota bacterium]|nr:hypothetical protein [Acidobacteriota bacterium]